MALRIRPFLGTAAALLLLAALDMSCTRRPANEETVLPKSHEDQVKRGEYLVETVGCESCHTPGGMYGLPDPQRRLAGSDVGWKGVWGVRYAPNLTPDEMTGLGRWSEDDIVRAIKLAERPDSTHIATPMPWFHFVYFTDEDAQAIAAYLKSVPPIAHKVPPRIPAGQKAFGAFIEVPPPPDWDKPAKS
ncbi:MAG TPA: c-type cytochrome [Candidatus Eisenbacteria bacterium]